MTQRPLKNRLDNLHPVRALGNFCYDIADRQRERADAGDAEAQRVMLLYGKIWLVLLVVWDELNGHDALGYDDPEFETRLSETFAGNLEDIQVAMYG